MKFKDIIKHIDAVNTEVEIYVGCNYDEPDFRGHVLDIPWYFLDYYLDSNEEYESICVKHDEVTNKSYLVLNLIEELEEIEQ